MSSKQIPAQHQKRLEIISTYLRELRFSEGLTQKELSQIMNLHRNTIIRAENAKNLTLLSLFELADALDININQLFQDIE
jgi:transcriptional regulator with XRE-family HTH domain